MSTETTTYVDENNEDRKLIVTHDSADNTTTVKMEDGNAAHGQGVTNEMLQKIDEKVSEFTSDNKLTGNIPADAEAIFNGLEIDNKDSLKNELIDKITEKLTPVSTGTSLNTGGKAKRSKKSAKKGKKSRGMKGKRGRRSAKKGRK